MVAVVTCLTAQVYLPTASSISSLHCLSCSDRPSCRGTRCGRVLSILCYAFLSPSQADRTQRPHHQDTACSRHWCIRDNSTNSICPSSHLHAQSVCGVSAVLSISTHPFIVTISKDATNFSSLYKQIHPSVTNTLSHAMFISVIPS